MNSFNQDDADYVRFCERLNQLMLEHGHEVVPAAQIYRSFDALARLDQRGFSLIKPGLFGRVIDTDLTQVVKLQAEKGGVYSVWWGVSLSYLPHDWTSVLRWHRTLKSSRLDLFQAPILEPEADWRAREASGANTLRGAAYFEERLNCMWERQAPRLWAWFDVVKSTAGVLAKAREYVNGGAAYEGFSPSPWMVVAFTLARMQRMAEARVALEDYCARRQEPPASHALLVMALEKAGTP